MKRLRHPRAWVGIAILIVAGLAWGVDKPVTPLLDQQDVQKLMQDGNYQEALAAFRARLRATTTAANQLPRDLRSAVECLRHLNQVAEFDELVESAVNAHPENWRLLAEAAQRYLQIEHFGYMISGEFQRGHHRGGGKLMHATERDRTRAVQLLVKAFSLAESDERARKREVAGVAEQLASGLLSDRSGQAAWRLQALSDLEELPDYEEGWGYDSGAGGAPVDAENNPVFHDLPDSWDAAQSDGERWRWALRRMAELDPQKKFQVLLTRANFLRSQFGVTTLRGYIEPLVARADAEGAAETSIYTLHTLEEDETLARLATGIQRFKLPQEHNFIRLYKRAIETANESGNKSQAWQAATQLASLFADRRQFPRSAEYWRTALEYATNDNQRRHANDQIQQIEKPWGQFEFGELQPAGAGATFEYRFRNGQRVEFTAHTIDVRQLLADLKAYLQSNPRELDGNKLQIEQLGYRLVHQQEQKYVGAEAARWAVDLEPRPAHFDRRTTVTSPLQKAGAYLVTAKMQDGNTVKMVLWVADTAILKKRLGKETLYYVTDATTGQPIEKANLELFGYKYERPRPNQMRIDVQQLAEQTDADGQAFVEIGDQQDHNRYQWLTIASTPEGRLAYLGFHQVWRMQHSDQRPEAVRTFAVTDRPVYRPGQQVNYKIWVQRPRYDELGESEFAHQTFQLEVFDPKGEKIATQKLTANGFGGVAGQLELDSGATLGQYRFQLVNYGGGTFRVEEYKKPEFEVTVDAPDEPLALGDEFQATITARYYFGEPVRNGTVKYKVTRTSRDDQWFPPRPWDWLYGRGYWWFGQDYGWYPGWSRWGHSSPRPWWIWRQPAPPEIVAEGEAPLDAEGKYALTIDTALAKELHPDKDHQYRIEAEVVDQSRRTIVGNGSVLVARQPFKVIAWTDRGFYRTGDTVTAHFEARRPDGKPVEGRGRLRLLAIRYPADAPNKPVETEVRAWDLSTNEDGRAELQLKASEPGQYRLSYQVTAVAGKEGEEHTVEGGHFFTIVGQGFDGSDFRFNDLELVPDKQQYAPGDKVQLQVNTNRRGSVVLLFVRPQNGVYARPRVIRLDGKSTLVELQVSQRDMPNFFVEAQTVSAGDVYTVARQIVVPPEKRIINVTVDPSAEEFKPGEEATVKVRLTDEAGQPVVGDTVLTVYDRSLEYISGGSNVGDIREAFWNWRRNHHPTTEHNLDRHSPNLVPPGEPAMQMLGAFGYLVGPDGQEGLQLDAADGGQRRGGSFNRALSGRGEFGDRMAPMAAPAMAKAADASESEVAADSGAAPAEVTPTVRTEFADTAYWAASVETGSDGLAELTFPMPENLTAWTFKVWSLAHGVRVGSDDAQAVTRKNLLVRLQTPRFLVERDEVVISANVHNYLPDAKQVRVRLELEGDYLAPTGELETVVEIESNGEQRVDWRLKATAEGTAKVRALALTDVESDAMQLDVPVKVHGMEKLIPHSDVIAADGNRAAFEVTVPTERREDQTRLQVQWSPTLAGAMVDALPYLIDYPYGCTEQTLNRFLPAVLTQRALQQMGIDLAAIRDKQVNLNPQELGEPRERAEGWRRFQANPVFDEAELNKVVKAGVQRLTEMQLQDGGWGWFSGFGERSTPHMTSIVVRGLIIAKRNDVAVVPGVVERGVEWLKNYQAQELAKLNNRDAEGNRRDKDKPFKSHADNLDALVYMVLTEAARDGVATPPEEPMAAMRKYLYNDRTRLAVYSLATFGLGLQNQVDMAGEGAAEGGDSPVEMLDMVLRNLSQYVVTDAENQTAYLNLPGGQWWYWYGSEFEAHAYYLKLLAANEPQSDVASGLVKYLLNNRKHATYWNSTRDTALVVEAMADYLQATGEGQHEMTVEVWLNGQRQKTVEITPAVLFSFDNQFVVEGADMEAGRHTVELRKQGPGRLYFNAYLSLFTLEDDIEAAGLELKVARKYYKLTPADATADVAGGRGQVVNQQVEKYDRTEIPNLGTVESGDLVEIELTVDSKNDYEYIILEDLKAAGFEPVEVRSGYTGNELGAYMELRDDRVSLFVRRLARGTHSVSYRMRAEIPGNFSALPTQAYAMYAPELKGNSNEIKVRVVDRD